MLLLQGPLYTYVNYLFISLYLFISPYLLLYAILPIYSS